MSKKNYCLRCVDLYKGISDDQFMEIADEALDSYIDAGEILYNEGDSYGKVFVVKEGEVELYKTEKEKIIILETLFPGDVFGDFGQGVYTHSARISRKAYLCQTPTSEFLQVVSAYPQIVFRLMQIMSERTIEYENKIALLSAPAKSQLYATISSLYIKNKKRFLSKVFPLPFKISHTQLAEKTGLNRVTITKLMKELQKEGKIHVDESNKSITVLEYANQ